MPLSLSRNERRVAAAAVVLTLVAAVAAWNPLHQRSQSQQAVFRNDSGRDAMLRLCADDACTKFEVTDAWAPGSSLREAVSDHGLLTRWLVQDAATGGRLGCLPLKLEHRYESVLVRASQMVPCPGSPLTVRTGRRLGA